MQPCSAGAQAGVTFSSERERPTPGGPSLSLSSTSWVVSLASLFVFVLVLGLLETATSDFGMVTRLRLT